MEKRVDPKTLSDDELIKRWKAWIEHTKFEAHHYYAFRFKAENVNKMFLENEALHTQGGAAVFDWLKELFKVYYLTVIRRELEGGQQQTLVAFLYELEKFSERVLTRKRFKTLYNQHLVEFGVADRDFDRIPGATCRWPTTSPDDDCISSASIRATRKRLEAFAEPVINYTNWQVAHRTQVPPTDITWGDIHRTMNRIFDTYARFNLLISGTVSMTRYPEPQYDWAQPFTLPWMPEGFTPWEKPDEPDEIK
jgi:hypothetical protein